MTLSLQPTPAAGMGPVSFLGLDTFLRGPCGQWGSPGPPERLGTGRHYGTLHASSRKDEVDLAMQTLLLAQEIPG